MKQPTSKLGGAGIGLRRNHMSTMLEEMPEGIDFLEVAPENWIDVGGRLGKAFAGIATQRPMVCHGLSLNLGGSLPIDLAFLDRIREFIDTWQPLHYGDHLSYCGDQGYLYELLPLPFTGESVEHIAGRIRQVQDYLGRRITVENASYYVSPGADMDESDFLSAVVAAADCDLLLDINNIYVNSVNHGFDAREFVDKVPGERIAYAHIAGHLHEPGELIIDTHGADVIDPVWDLLDYAYQVHGVFPTMIERDQNIPDLPELMTEVEHLKQIQQRNAGEMPLAANHG